MLRAAVPVGRVVGSSLALGFILAFGIASTAGAQNVVTRVAGSGGSRGSVDALGTAARFNGPYDVVMNAAATIAYVSDNSNYTIRRIDLATSEVTTIAGSPGERGSANGTGAAARFGYPAGMVLSADGSTLYLCDVTNHTIRRVDLATSAVTTIAGLAEQSGYVDATGSAARFYYPTALR